MNLLLKKIKLTKSSSYLNPNIINQSSRDKKNVDNNTNAVDKKKELAKEKTFFLSGLK